MSRPEGRHVLRRARTAMSLPGRIVEVEDRCVALETHVVAKLDEMRSELAEIRMLSNAAPGRRGGRDRAGRAAVALERGSARRPRGGGRSRSGRRWRPRRPYDGRRRARRRRGPRLSMERAAGARRRARRRRPPGLQSPSSRTAASAATPLSWALALERLPDPTSSGRYLLNPDLPPPGPIEELLSDAARSPTPARRARSVRGARVFHALSPFDLALDPSAQSGRAAAIAAGSLRSRPPSTTSFRRATQSASSSTPVERRRYRTRLELVRRPPPLHVLSAAVARGPRRATRCRAGARRARRRRGARRAFPSRPLAHGGATEHATRACDQRASAGRYVLCPSGSHPRKNNERLIEAWSQLPGELRDARQLVITCELPEPTAHHLRHLASSLGIADRGRRHGLRRRRRPRSPSTREPSSSASRPSPRDSACRSPRRWPAADAGRSARTAPPSTSSSRRDPLRPRRRSTTIAGAIAAALDRRRAPPGAPRAP